MRFHEYKTVYGLLGGGATRDQFLSHCRENVANYVSRKTGGDVRGLARTICREELVIITQIECEHAWMNLRRPYYSVYPLIAESLIRLDLERVRGTAIVHPVDELLIRFPVGRELSIDGEGGHLVSTMLISNHASKKGRYLRVFAKGVYGEEKESRFALSLDDRCVEDSFCEVAGESGSSVAMKNALRLACTIALLGDNPELVRPDVLDDDRLRYEETSDQKYVDRAHSRGKVGWTVGADIEVDTHFRRPHFALRWTGIGGAIPRIVPVKGCVVRGHKLTEVPQGYLDDIPTGAQP